MIKGLEDLGCARLNGEDQTICVLSDSFDNNGGATDLQASGDLPLVNVVKVAHGCTRLFLNTRTPSPLSAVLQSRDIHVFWTARDFYRFLFHTRERDIAYLLVRFASDVNCLVSSKPSQCMHGVVLPMNRR